jgi:hypothetical protein
MDRDSRIAIYESTSATSTETRAKITKSLRSRAPASTDVLCMPRFARINRLPRIDRGWNYRTTFEVKIERRERRSQLMGESCLCIDASDTAGSNDNSFPRLDFPPRWYRSLTAFTPTLWRFNMLMTLDASFPLHIATLTDMQQCANTAG